MRNGIIAAFAIAVTSALVGLSITAARRPGRFLFRQSVPFTKKGTVISVSAGADLQSALDAASPGDSIVLAAGATYTGHFILPAKTGNAFITIRGSQGDQLPPDNTRVAPGDAASMPKVICSQCPAISAAPGAHHYRLRGIEIHPAENVYADELIELGASGKNTNEQPHDFELDQMFIHGDPAKGSKRGIGLNSGRATIRNSYFTDFKSDFQDSQAIAGWFGTGPYLIVNNFLEASGEDLIFGGAAPAIQNLVPSDIGIYYNYFHKQESWQGKWRIKNLFELKNARRVKMRYNVLENNWAGAQNGFGVLFTVRTCEAGNYPWAVVKDVDFSYNILRHSNQGINILGQDDGRDGCPAPRVAGQTSDIHVENNLLEDLFDQGTAVQILSGAERIVFDHNTMLQTGDTMMLAGSPSHDVVFRNNIVPRFHYGIVGDSRAEGSSTLNTYLPGAVFQRNIIPGADPRSYPGDNFYPGSLKDVGFVSLSEHIYALAPSSKFRGKGTDGKDPGVDFNTLRAKTAGVMKGVLPAEDMGEALSGFKTRPPL